MGTLFRELDKYDLEEEARIHKNTPEEEALRLADSVYPIKANTFRKPPAIIQVEEIAYKPKKIIELAHFINKELSDDLIIEEACRLCVDYKTKSVESDEIVEIWFDSANMQIFLKWCEPRENDLFN